MICIYNYPLRSYAHGILTNFMRENGFNVEPHYGGLSTAWRATFSNGKEGRVLGINSEMDALPGIGHACGHNLIAAAGVGIAVAAKSAIEKHNIPGKIVVLGTPGRAILSVESIGLFNFLS